MKDGWKKDVINIIKIFLRNKSTMMHTTTQDSVQDTMQVVIYPDMKMIIKSPYELWLKKLKYKDIPNIINNSLFIKGTRDKGTKKDKESFYYKLGYEIEELYSEEYSLENKLSEWEYGFDDEYSGIYETIFSIENDYQSAIDNFPLADLFPEAVEKAKNIYARISLPDMQDLENLLEYALNNINKFEDENRVKIYPIILKNILKEAKIK